MSMVGRRFESRCGDLIAGSYSVFGFGQMRIADDLGMRVCRLGTAGFYGKSSPMHTSRIQLLFPCSVVALVRFYDPHNICLEWIVLWRHLSNEVVADDGNFSEDVLSYSWHLVEE